MTAFTTLVDGGLSVKIGGTPTNTSPWVTGGTERQSAVHGLEWESTNQGDGSCSFWVEVTDPFDPQADYPELVHGAAVVVSHTLGSVCTRLYTGYILIDPTSTQTGPYIVTVECGGILEIAKGRTDFGYLATDADASQWKAHRNNSSLWSITTDGKVEVGIAKGTAVTANNTGAAGYVPFDGYTYLCTPISGGPFEGVIQVQGLVSWDLRDGFEAALGWSLNYVDSPAYTGFTAVTGPTLPWSMNTTGAYQHFFLEIPSGSAPDGAGYIVLLLYSPVDITTTATRYIEFTGTAANPFGVFIGTNAQITLSQAMESIDSTIGLSSSSDVETIGNVLPSIAQRPPTDPVTALGNLAAQASCLVEWGYFGVQFRAKPMSTSSAAIRALPNCYEIDTDMAGVVWNVEQHPESGQPIALRLLYSCLNDSVWPDGTILAVIAPSDPGWSGGTPFTGASAPVLIVDFSSISMGESQAYATAQTLAKLLGQGGTSGTLTTPSIALPVESGGTKPAPYWHGADWVETTGGSTGPLYITRWHVDVDSGACDGDVGLAADVLLNQLVAAGVVDPAFVRRIRGNESIVPRRGKR